MALPMLSDLSEEFSLNVKRDEKTMRTLLRQAATGLYFQGPDQWTTERERAHNFKMIDRAVEFARRWNLPDVELVFAFEDAEEVTRVPLDKMELRYSQA
jgi:hypothetical protein